MRVVCGECRVAFEAKSKKAKWCSDRCRKRHARRPGGSGSRLRVAPEPEQLDPEQAALLTQLTQGADLASDTEPAETEEAIAPAEPAEPTRFEQATLLELQRLDAVDTMLGQQALAVARRVAGESETGAAVASLSREHSRLMDQIAVRAKAQLDPVEKARSTGAYVYRGSAVPAGEAAAAAG